MERGLTYRFEEIEEGGYYAEVVGLPPCFTDGKTMDETLDHIREVVALIIDVAKDGMIELPTEFEWLLTSSEWALPADEPVAG